jgi:outer membrane lipase/esterase
MTSPKALLCASIAIAATTALAAPASAQRVNRIVAFGDSYADDGNLFELLGIPRPAAYPNGRFSNGTNFVDTMGQRLNVPIQNFAIGGAFTGNGNINGPGIPGFVTEWQSFLAGGGPAAFPRTTGRFEANDLVVISIGGNDARAYERSLGLNPTAAQIQGLIAGAPGQATLRVAEATTGVNALVNAGARNITFLAGDVGRLPEVAGLPVAAVGTAYATAFNNGIQTSLAATANQGVIVNYLDLNRIGDRVAANPAAFGLQSAGAVSAAGAAGGLSDLFLFYADQVHLTSAGFAIVGQYAVRQLEAPLQLAAPADVGLLTANSFASTLEGRLDLSDARFGSGTGGRLRVFAGAETARRDRPEGMMNFRYEIDSFGVTGGLEYDAGNGLVVGAAGNYTRGEADVQGGLGRSRVRAWQGGAYAGWAMGGFFLQGQATYGSLSYRIDRQGVIDSMTATPDGNVFTAGGQAGFLFNLGGLRLGPVIGLRYADVDVDAYTEQGDAALTLNVAEQGDTSLTGHAGIEARGSLDMGGLAVRPYLSASVEQEFDGDARTIRYALTTAPGIVNQWALPGRSEDMYGRITAGANFTVTDAIALQVRATTSLGQDEGNEAAGFAALRVAF